MTFEILAYAMTVAAAVLGLRFVFAGASILREWGIETTTGALVVSRRLGAVYLGLALAFFLGRSAPPTELRSAFCLGVCAMCTLLAGLGGFELLAGRARRRIVVSVVMELVLAAALGWFGWRGR
ncbi:MAG: hypothetical protein U0414_31695 [Polyangiaceae bacterium]